MFEAVVSHHQVGITVAVEVTGRRRTRREARAVVDGGLESTRTITQKHRNVAGAVGWMPRSKWPPDSCSVSSASGRAAGYSSFSD